MRFEPRLPPPPPPRQRLQGVLLVLVALFALAGCGDGGGRTTAPVQIQLPPVSQSVGEGMSAVLVVAATSDTPVTYQWQRDGVPIAGATDPIYVTPALSVDDSGVKYSVIVADASGSTDVASSTVTVKPVAPAIGGQSQSPAATPGQNPTFSVQASGSKPLTYQWQRDGVDIPGANTLSYTPAAGSNPGSTWNVVVGNPAGAVTSGDFTLPDNDAGPVVLSMLQVGVVNAGQGLVISTALSGNPPFTYQWLRNGQPVAGAAGTSNNPTLQLNTSILTAADNGVRYSLTVSNAQGSTRSADAQIFVIDAPLVAAGGSHSLARSASGGTVWTWGDNRYGQLGRSTATSSSTPGVVAGLSGVKAIAAGADHSLALKSDGTVWAWGRNAAGAIGDGTQTDRPLPKRVAGLENVSVVAVAAAEGRSFALGADGRLWGWGDNSTGALGTGTQNQALVPTVVGGSEAGFSRIVQVAAGARHTLALSAAGQVFAMGEIAVPPLNSSTILSSPSLVAGLASMSSLAAGDGFSVALDINGRLWSWGSNGSGQLGLGDSMPRAMPAAIDRTQAGGPLLPTLRLATGRDFALVRSLNGSMLAWGAGAHGQLGTGVVAGASPSPVAVATLQQMASVAGGRGHALAVRADGTVYAWGDNSAGQLGIGSSEQFRAAPAQVPGLNLN